MIKEKEKNQITIETIRMGITSSSKRAIYENDPKKILHVTSQHLDAMGKPIRGGVFSKEHFGSNVSKSPEFYSCDCGAVTGKINYTKKTLCGECNTICEDYSVDISKSATYYLGENNFVMNPMAFIYLEKFFGTDNINKITNISNSILQRILYSPPEVDNNARPIKRPDRYNHYHVGFLKFKEYFPAILEEYKNNMEKNYKYNVRMVSYYLLMDMYKKGFIFENYIHISPLNIRQLVVKFNDGSEKPKITIDEISNIYMQIATDIGILVDMPSESDNSQELFEYDKIRNDVLMSIQERLLALVPTVINKIKSKNGLIRSSILGGRTNMTIRPTIIPKDGSERTLPDEISVGYTQLVDVFKYMIAQRLTMEPEFANISFGQILRFIILNKFVNGKPNNKLYGMVNEIIKETNGIPVILNRNPTNDFTSQLAMRITKCMYSATDTNAHVPNIILDSLNGDYDGDQVNLTIIMTDSFFNYTRNYRLGILNNGPHYGFSDKANPQRDALAGLTYLLRL